MLVRDNKFSIKSIVPFGEDEEDDRIELNQKLGTLVYKHGLYWIYHYKSLFKKDNPTEPLSGTEF